MRTFCLANTWTRWKNCDKWSENMFLRQLPILSASHRGYIIANLLLEFISFSAVLSTILIASLFK